MQSPQWRVAVAGDKLLLVVHQLDRRRPQLEAVNPVIVRKAVALGKEIRK
jgi:hypothetical protein